VKCADCGGIVSRSARACPHCGSTRFSYGKKILVWGGLAACAFFGYQLIYHPQETRSLIGDAGLRILRAVFNWSTNAESNQSCAIQFSQFERNSDQTFKEYRYTFSVRDLEDRNKATTYQGRTLEEVIITRPGSDQNHIGYVNRQQFLNQKNACG
jgi:hypothetical protein